MLASRRVSSIVLKELLHKFAPDEDYLHFDTPHFYTIQEYIDRDGPEFWNDFATPNEFDFKLA